MQPRGTVQGATPDRDLHEKVDRMLREMTDLRQEARRKIPTYVDEHGYQSAGLTLEVKPQSRNLYRLFNLFAYVSAGSGATLTLGDRVIPLPTGISNWPDLYWLVRFQDVRNLTATASGILFLSLTGEETADQYGWG